MKTTLQSVAAMTFAIGIATPAFAAPAMHASMGMHAMAAPTHTMTAPTTHTMAAPATHTPRALGQPNVSCGSPSAPFTPGNAASAPGSAFNPEGNAGTRYAGEQPQNSRNPAAVSQYDSACAHQTR